MQQVLVTDPITNILLMRKIRIDRNRDYSLILSDLMHQQPLLPSCQILVKTTYRGKRAIYQRESRPKTESDLALPGDLLTLKDTIKAISEKFGHPSLSRGTQNSEERLLTFCDGDAQIRVGKQGEIFKACVISSVVYRKVRQVEEDEYYAAIEAQSEQLGKKYSDINFSREDSRIAKGENYTLRLKGVKKMGELVEDLIEYTSEDGLTGSDVCLDTAVEIKNKAVVRSCTLNSERESLLPREGDCGFFTLAGDTNKKAKVYYAGSSPMSYRIKIYAEKPQIVMLAVEELLGSCSLLCKIKDDTHLIEMKSRIFGTLTAAVVRKGVVWVCPIDLTTFLVRMR